MSAHAAAVTDWFERYVETQITAARADADRARGEAVTELGKARTELAEATRNLTAAKLELTAADQVIEQLRARITELTVPPVDTDPHVSRKPRSFKTTQEAITALGLPTDANYVTWRPEWTHLEQAFTALTPNDVLVLPERPEPYLIDSSKGFIAAGVKDMEYLSDADFNAKGYTGKVVTGVTPVNSSSNRLWFEMSRARRGILGLGPGAVIKASTSGWRGFRQPKDNMIVTYTNGTKGTLVGAQNKLIGTEHVSPVYANFTLTKEDLGTVAYNAIGNSSTTRGGTFFIRNVWIDRAMNGFAGVPNGETAGIILGWGKYDIENVLVTTDETSSSPIMFNRNTGGRMRNVWLGMPAQGMLTYWRCSGVNELTDVTVHAQKAGINLEEEEAGFVLNWTGGAINVASKGSAFHLNINPSGGTQKITLRNVRLTGYYGANDGKLMAHVYTTAGKQKKTDVTWDGGEVMYLPATNWIA